MAYQGDFNVTTFTYPKEQLECILWNESNKDFTFIKREYVRMGRWCVIYAITFRDNITEKHYVATIQQPATEQQDCDTWFGQDEIECIEVEPYETTVTLYREVECPTKIQQSESSTHMPSES